MISPKRDPKTGLTAREAQVIQLYDGGITTQKEIGEILGCSHEVVGVVMRRPHVIKAVQHRSATEGLAPYIATREELQAFWTELIRDNTQRGTDRLKASELLGKSFALFTDKVETKAIVSFEDMLKKLDAEAEDFSDL